MPVWKRILGGVLLVAAALAAINFYRGPHLFGGYAKYAMAASFALVFIWIHFVVERADKNAVELELAAVPTRTYVRLYPWKTAITVVCMLATPLGIFWIKNDFDWTVFAIVEVVMIGVLLRFWYQNRPLHRRA